MPNYAILSGQIEKWPNKAIMAQLFQEAGFLITVGKYSIRFNEFDHFVFRDFGGKNFEPRPCITADHHSVGELLLFSKRISDTLATNFIRHRFEIYDANENLAGYLHFKWPNNQN